MREGTADGVDLRILRALQRDARISNADLARRLRMAPSAVHGRVRRLLAAGLIRAFEARLDPEALGAGLVAFVSIRVRERAACGAVGRSLAKFPEVLEVHSVAGEDGYLIKVRVPGTAALNDLLRDRIGPLRAVESTRTTIVLSTEKETSLFPVPGPDDAV